jgi:CheY-like chemotaxis protein
MARAPKHTLLLADGDVIIRLTLGEYLRECGLTVLEAASGAEAKSILQSGLSVDTVVCDAQVPGAVNGFALAQWVRRYRSAIDVVLTTTLDTKVETAARICSWGGGGPPDTARLMARIRALTAERKRRSRPPSSTANTRPRRRRT